MPLTVSKLETRNALKITDLCNYSERQEFRASLHYYCWFCSRSLRGTLDTEEMPNRKIPSKHWMDKRKSEIL